MALFGVANRAFPSSTPEEESGPYVRDRVPAPGAGGVAPTVNVTFTIASALPRTVDLTTVVIQLEINTDGLITAYDGSAGGFQTGYTGTDIHGSNAFEDYYDFVIDPDVDFPNNAVISVAIAAQDDAANPLTPPELYTFIVEFVPENIPLLLGDAITLTDELDIEHILPTVGIYPTVDSIFGGVQVEIYSSVRLLDTSLDDSFRVPSAVWTGGGTRTPSGLVLRDGESVTISDDFTHFDISFGFTGENVTLTATGAVSTSTLDLQSDQAKGTTQYGSSSLARVGPGTLRVIRVRDKWWMYFQDVLVHYAEFQIQEPVTLSIDVAGTNVASYIYDLVIRSNVLIGNNLLKDVISPYTHRMLGTIPPGLVGAQDVLVFGLFGLGTTTFTYSQSTPKTVGKRLLTVLDLHADRTIHNKKL